MSLTLFKASCAPSTHPSGPRLEGGSQARRGQNLRRHSLSAPCEVWPCPDTKPRLFLYLAVSVSLFTPWCPCPEKTDMKEPDSALSLTEERDKRINNCKTVHWLLWEPQGGTPDSVGVVVGGRNVVRGFLAKESPEWQLQAWLPICVGWGCRCANIYVNKVLFSSSGIFISKFREKKMNYILSSSVTFQTF